MYVGAVTERVQEVCQDKNTPMMLLFPGKCTVISFFRFSLNFFFNIMVTNFLGN